MSDVNVAVPAASTRARCLRCGGRMIVNGEGDFACFTCGNVVYLVPPMDVPESMRRERRTHHAGIELS
jgi:tRNA(Ile2) C34 agmatinyltransferase TiaS